ncbi:MAG: hypothetical protein AAF541_20955 [Pseudomonadota bacterium]
MNVKAAQNRSFTGSFAAGDSIPCVPQASTAIRELKSTGAASMLEGREITMNIMNLIQQHPLLFADLKGLGLPTTAIHRIAKEISVQLGGSEEYNLCFILTALNSDEFVANTNVAEIANHTHTPACLVQSVVLTLAPWVDRFRMANQVG